MTLSFGKIDAMKWTRPFRFRHVKNHDFAIHSSASPSRRLQRKFRAVPPSPSWGVAPHAKRCSAHPGPRARTEFSDMKRRARF